MSTLLWVILAIAYLTALVFLGVATLRKGHYILFVIGIIFPVMWIVGALIGPARGARAASL